MIAWVLECCSVTSNICRPPGAELFSCFRLEFWGDLQIFVKFVLWTWRWKLAAFHGLLHTSRWCDLAFTPCVTPRSKLLVHIVTLTCHRQSCHSIREQYYRGLRIECELKSPVYCTMFACVRFGEFCKAIIVSFHIFHTSRLHRQHGLAFFW